MKANLMMFALIPVYLLVVSANALAEDCYLDVASAGNYNSQVIEGFTVPIISEYILPLKQIPPFGLDNEACRYTLNITETRTKTTVTISGSTFNLSGESTLAGINGVQQAIVKSILGKKPTSKNNLCASFSNLIPQDCGVDLISQPNEEEVETWDLIKDTDTHEDIVDFIQTFPNGRYRYLANLKLIRFNQNPISIDKNKNGTSVQEEELWNQIKKTKKKEELEYFLAEFPKGKKKRIASLLFRKINRSSKKADQEKLNRTQRINQPRFDGLYYTTFELDTRGKKTSCTGFLRFFPNGKALYWFNQDFSCKPEIRPDDPKRLEFVSRALCLNPGCREKLHYPDVRTKWIISMQQYNWELTDQQEVLLKHKIRRKNLSGAYETENIKPTELGSIYPAGIRVHGAHNAQDYQNEDIWSYKFTPYQGLKKTQAKCNYDHFTSEGYKILDNIKTGNKGNYEKSTDHHTAIRWFRSAIDCAPEKKEAYYGIAELHELKSQTIDAGGYYKDVLSMYPTEKKATEGIAALYLKRKLYTLAAESLNTYITKNDSKEKDIWKKYAEAAFYDCQCDKVSEISKAGIIDHQQDALLNHFLGICALKKGNAEEGIAFLKKRTEIDNYQYARKELQYLVRLATNVLRNKAYKVWYQALKTGEKPKRYNRRSCFLRK